MGNGEVTFDEHSSIIMTFLLRLLLLCPHHWLLVTLLLPQQIKTLLHKQACRTKEMNQCLTKHRLQTQMCLKPCYQLGNH